MCDKEKRDTLFKKKKKKIPDGASSLGEEYHGSSIFIFTAFSHTCLFSYKRALPRSSPLSSSINSPVHLFTEGSIELTLSEGGEKRSQTQRLSSLGAGILLRRCLAAVDEARWRGIHRTCVVQRGGSETFGQIKEGKRSILEPFPSDLPDGS